MSEKEISSFCVRPTPRAGLCALGAVLQAKHFFAPVEARVQIHQKEILHQVIDKLKIRFITLLSGAAGLYLSDKVVRADPAIQSCFGCSSCPDQSTIHRLFVAGTTDNVEQLRSACTDLFQQHSLASQHDFEKDLLILDIDMQGQRTSKHAQQAAKGYFPGHRGAYGRQQVRVLAGQYDEILVDRLDPGNSVLGPLIAPLMQAAESCLNLVPDQRWRVMVRIDASGGGEDRIDWLLKQGYQVHIKLKGSDRAYQLAQTVDVWRSDPAHPNREVGLVGRPYRYIRPTIQVAARYPQAKGGYTYHVIVSSLAPEQVVALSHFPPAAAWEAELIIFAYANVYDDRSGPIEHSFGEDGQGFYAGKRHHRIFVAQAMRMLLTSLAHNTLAWSRVWLSAACPDLAALGMLRLVRDVLGMPGHISFDARGTLREISFNRLDPLAAPVASGFRDLLTPLGVAVTLADP